MANLTKYQTATCIAIFFHIIGLVGILVFKSQLIIQSTPVNLLLSGALLVWTQKEKNNYYYLFVVIVAIAGFAVEVIGVNTSLLFGNYSYGNVLGVKFKNVPLLISLNWFIIIYCCGITVHTLLTSVIDKAAVQSKTPPLIVKAISIITDGATLAVLFDWLMEPVAIKLGFWQWKGNGTIPLYNYICWIVISLLLLTIFHVLPFNKQNKFATNLLLIQFMFFLLLRTFL
ncbi:MAG: carotenoid biosynthesis protein [Ferruginibacter sp.]|nr:carotenoid biosynthesis protein [Ferruginibacter sp.]